MDFLRVTVKVLNSYEISKIGAEQRGKIVIYSRETERGA